VKPGDLNVGIYTKEIRDHYIAYRLGKYLIDHPNAKPTKARKYARVAWLRKITGDKRKMH
jgi:hypothetical protein